MLNIFNTTKVEIATSLYFIIGFCLTLLSIHLFQKYLPRDIGREDAYNSEVSKGKPRGAGIIFMTSFCIISILLVKLEWNYIVYLLLAFISMLTGYLDDKATISWGRLKKGLLDFLIAAIASIVFMITNPDYIGTYFLGTFIHLNVLVYFICSVSLIWLSINVTNCSDGVDGLSGSLSIITLLTIAFCFKGSNIYLIMILVSTITAYLMYNVSPSRLMMGDAGSRSIGFIIAVLVLQTYNPILFILISFMLLLNGGLGLIKIILIKLGKKNALKDIRTPVHDHVRSKWNWSDNQVVFRFSVFQLLASLLVVIIVSLY